MLLILSFALIPPIVLMVWVYRLDKIEKEPPSLLLRLFIYGCLTTIAAALLEMVGFAIIQRLAYISPLIYQIIGNFIIVACAEEGVKHFALRKGTWRHPAFNYQFDAVLYGAIVSLGFAAAENVKYVLGFGLSVAPIRAVTAIPLHCIVGIFMGHFYGLAKTASIDMNAAQQKHYMIMSMLIPVLIHGFYDFVASYGVVFMTILFYAFIIILDMIAFRLVRKYSRTDQPV